MLLAVILPVLARVGREDNDRGSRMALSCSHFDIVGPLAPERERARWGQGHRDARQRAAAGAKPK